MKKKELKFSDRISEICKLLESAQKDYAWYSGKVMEMDRLTQDYLHMLELDGLKYEERAKVATKLTKCRQERRKYKDTVQALEPVCELMNSDRGKQFLRQLQEALGRTRRNEERMKTRVYCPRVLGQEEH